MGWLIGKKATTRVEGVALVKAGRKIRATQPKIDGKKLGAANRQRLSKRTSN